MSVIDVTVTGEPKTTVRMVDEPVVPKQSPFIWRSILWKVYLLTLDALQIEDMALIIHRNFGSRQRMNADN